MTKRVRFGGLLLFVLYFISIVSAMDLSAFDTYLAEYDAFAASLA